MPDDEIDEQKFFNVIDKILPHLYGLKVEEGVTVLLTILCNTMADHGMTAEEATRQFLRGYKMVLRHRKEYGVGKGKGK